jgi:hypothetical protein
MSDPNELSEEERKKLNSGFPALTAKVVISGKEEIEKLEKENEKLEMEKLELENQIEKIATAAFDKKKKELGAPEEFETVEELEAWRREHAEERTRNPALNPELGGHGGSGKAPLSGEPSSHESANVKNYPNIESMISDLNERSRSNIPEVREEAQQILKQLHAKASKSKNVPFEREIDLMKLVEDKRKKAKERGETLEHWSEL